MMRVLTDFLTVNCLVREREGESSSCFREREGQGAEEVCVGVGVWSLGDFKVWGDKRRKVCNFGCICVWDLFGVHLS